MVVSFVSHTCCIDFRPQQAEQKLAARLEKDAKAARKKARDAETRAAEAKARADAARAMNDYLAHEVRNPLSVAIGGLFFASDALGVDAPPDVTSNLGMVSTSLTYIEELLTSMLAAKPRYTSRTLCTI